MGVPSKRLINAVLINLVTPHKYQPKTIFQIIFFSFFNFFCWCLEQKQRTIHCIQ